jgi:hypothetical protein
MRRASTAVAVAVVAAGVLSGCGGSSYCGSVKDNQGALDSFGSARTTEAYQNYAKVVNAVAAVAPKNIAKEWSDIAAATTDVVKQTNALGLKLEDIPTPQEFTSTDKSAKAKVAAFEALRTTLKLTDSDFAATAPLNKSFLTFSQTVKEHGGNVVKNVKQECKIVLK